MSKDISSIYEKLRQNPEFRKKVFIEQPTPYNESKSEVRTYENPMARAPSNLNESITLINRRLDNIEKALKLVMETHKRLIG